MNSISIPKGIWKWFFITFAITMIILAAIVLKKDAAPTQKKQTAQIQERLPAPAKIPATTIKPKPQEKWVFGFRAEFEQIALAANRNINQSSAREYNVTSFNVSEREIKFSYIVDKKTTRHARLALDEHGYFSGVADKEKTRKLRIWLAKDKNSPGNFIGYMQDWDAKYPGKQYPQVAAYLRRQ
ncbi:TPA: hypothetical protein DEW47_00455 [Patescibacteria group bacterium]|nr:MAG: hypothetical protein UT71_C0026G0003 [Parcubacteria group bacterium GW2011_GWF2_40_10]KKR47133.1 MAG: hypothetical protein UT83_C0013G0011 [Parcubacteria group bacterium GW2011_GWA2_40_143]KKR59721.1 MAG: hypothetical protein UT97_C0012G0009 [Parcubacteria group bacterium GW2011_GWC2_40_31]KKR80348.1 MAG: hypothetical protein UU28_C0042G0006 [Parcubacteria group bacterium GW2011_GWD2_40_9]HCI04440.1 hypothetical protein [Patescibacteria group bacterium]